MAGLLDRYDMMQKRPFGTNTALSDGNEHGVGGTFGNQYRAQAADYGRALRLLGRASRHGSLESRARAAVTRTGLREDAMNKGFTPGGITRWGEQNSGILGRQAALEQADKDAAAAAEFNRTRAEEATAEGAVPEENPAANIAAVPELSGHIPADPRTSLGTKAANAGLDLGANPTDSALLRYRQGLDRAIGQAKTTEEITDIKGAAGRYGNVSDEAFAARRKWWQRRGGI